MDSPYIVQDIMFRGLDPGCFVSYIGLNLLCNWLTQLSVILQVKEIKEEW